MLSQTAFEMALSLLSIKFKEEFHPTIKGIWWKYFEKNLSDSELLEAVENAVLHSRFLPTAGELVAFIQGDKEAQAIADWQIVIRAASYSRDRAEKTLAYVNARCRVALQAIGGLVAVANCESEFQRSGLQKQFVVVYCSNLKEDERSLPQASAAPKYYKAEEVESVPMPADIKEKLEKLLKQKFKSEN